MNTSAGCSNSAMFSSHDSTRQPSHGFHISGRNKGIREIDLSLVFGNATLLSSGTGKGAGKNSQTRNEVQDMLALITSLDISHNEIENLNNLYILRSLRDLDTSYNLISQISGLPSRLTRLNLSHNKLCSLDGVSSLLHLRELDVSSNRLTNFMGLSSRLPLQVLRADDNRIVSTLGLEEMPHLHLLSMSNNFIESLHELQFLRRAGSLQTLSFKNNPIAQLNGYRQLVAQQQIALLTLDEEPILRYPDHVSTEDHKGASVARVTPSLVTTETTPPKNRTIMNKIENVLTVDSRLEAQDTKFDNSLSSNAWHQRDRSQGLGRSVITPEYQQPLNFLKEDPSVELMESPMPIASSHPPEPIRINSKLTFREDANGNHGMGIATQSLATTQIRNDPSNTYTKQFLATRTPQSSSIQETTGAVTPGSLTSSRKSSLVSKKTPKNRSLLPYQRHRDSRDDGTEKCSNGDKASPYNGFVSSSVHQQDPVGDNATMALLHDSLVAQEQLKKENQMLRTKLKNVEDQLSESRRVISEQLSKLANSRVATEALRHAESEFKEQVERSKRHAKAIEKHHKNEIKTLQTQYERTKAFYEAQIADLQQQLAVEQNQSGYRTGSRGNEKHPKDPSLPLSRPLPDLITSAALYSKNLSASEVVSDVSEQRLEAQNLVESMPNLNKSVSNIEHSPSDSTKSDGHLDERLRTSLFHELAESEPKAEASHQKQMTSLNIEKECSEEAEKSMETEPTFAIDARAFLEAVVLSKQYTIQKQSDSYMPEVEDVARCRSQQPSPREQTQQ